MLPLEWAKEIIMKSFDKGLEKVLSSPRHTIPVHNWEKENRAFLEEHHLTTSSGATKFCFISSEVDWVIKSSFAITDWQGNKVDFCEVEYKNYLAAYEEHLERFFAPIYFIGNINGFNFYLQEKEEIDEGAIESSLEDYYSSNYGGSYDSFYSDNMDEEEIILAILGPNADVDHLIDFVSEREINDLHSANWGINASGDVVMIDYSGYF